MKVAFIILCALHTSTGLQSIVTNHPICTDMANWYKDNYPSITAPELFIVVSTCEGIVNFQDSGLGGGSLILAYSTPCKKAITINAREMSGANVSMEHNLVDITQQIGVPGQLAGFLYLYHKLNLCSYKPALSFKDLFTQNIQLAREGFPSDTKLPFHTPYKTMLRNLPLANFLQWIADAGTNKTNLYSEDSPLPKKLAEEIQSGGGLITEQDIQLYKVKIKPAYWAKCLNYTFFGTTTPGAGFLQLFGCRLIEARFEEYRSNPAHRQEYFVKVLQILYLVKPYLFSLEFRRQLMIHYKSIASTIHFSAPIYTDIPDFIGPVRLPKAMAFGESWEEGTSNICINMDDMAICGTNTINWHLGSGYWSSNFGFPYNNQLSDFTFYNPNSMNRPLPYKRPQSSISATIVSETNGDGKAVFGAGAAGGPKIVAATFIPLMQMVLGAALNESITCNAAQLLPRCYFEKDGLALLCEESSTTKSIKDYAPKMSFSEISRYSAATIFNSEAACFDPRRGGKSFVWSKNKTNHNETKV